MFVRLELEFERPFRSSSSSCYALFSNVNSRSSRAAKTFIADVIPQKKRYTLTCSITDTHGGGGRGAHRQLTGCWTDGRTDGQTHIFLPPSKCAKDRVLDIRDLREFINRCFHSDLKKQNLLVH